MTTLLPEPGFAVDQGEAALTQVRLFDAPAEVLDFGRHIERLVGTSGVTGSISGHTGPAVFGSYAVVLLCG